MTDERNLELLRAVDPSIAHTAELHNDVNVSLDYLDELIQAARQQGQDDADLKARKEGGYWYRRALFAEEGLRTLVLSTALLGRDDITAEEEMRSCARVADTILAESRKKELPNYEDFIRNRRQAQVLTWAKKAFGTTTAVAPFERALRMLEEAVELFQSASAVAAVNASEAKQRVLNTANRVFAKEPGDLKREFGGLMVTTLCLAENHGISLAEAEKDEFARVLSIPPSKWRERHAKKHAEGITSQGED